MKRKKELTRRQKALRRLAIAALVLVVMNYVGSYGLTPGHAIRLAEEAMDCGRTKVIKDLGPAPVEHDDPNRLYLSANERSVLFTAAQYRLSDGWEAREPFCIDCTTDAPAYGAVYRVYSMWSEEPEKPEDRDDPSKWSNYDEVWYLFGRVDDPRATQLRGRVVLREEKEGEDLEVLAEVNSERWEWLQKDGESYFLFPLMARGPEVPRTGRGYLVYQYQLLDRDGKVLYEDKDVDGVMVYLHRDS